MPNHYAEWIHEQQNILPAGGGGASTSHMSAATGQRGVGEGRTAGEEGRAGRAGREGGERAGAEVLEHISPYINIRM